MAWLNYTHKPTRIRAERWFLNVGLVPGMALYDHIHHGGMVISRPDHVEPVHDHPAAVIQGNRGFHGVWEGDYVCRGDAGELYPVPPEIFQTRYDLDAGQHRQPIDAARLEADIAREVQSTIDKA